MSREKITFSFGENWRRFLDTSLTEDRVVEAERSLTGFLCLSGLSGRTLLDIGCGSGLFSLAALRLGADSVMSFDLDPQSVACCKYLREREGNPDRWTILSGSVLDNHFLDSLPKADVVYSWGVLHHTGRMWEAIENAIELVRPGGVLFIAIYNKVEGPFGSQSWLKLKRTYNSAPCLLKILMEYGFLSLVITKMLLTLRNPATEIQDYKKKRGMSFRTDIRDSLGGYPYEYASPEEIFIFCKKHGLELENMKTVNSLALNEFLFRKKIKRPIVRWQIISPDLKISGLFIVTEKMFSIR